jgi:CheY-like chemotaxis protein
MDWSDKTVIVAEDEDANFLLLTEYLEPTEIQIIHASDGHELLELLKKDEPDIILLDMKMPKMSGFEVISKIRQLNKSVPIIAQTAYTMIGDKDKIIKAGCNDYISKPIEENKLIEKMSQYLNR